MAFDQTAWEALIDKATGAPDEYVVQALYLLAVQQEHQLDEIKTVLDDIHHHAELTANRLLDLREPE